MSPISVAQSYQAMVFPLRTTKSLVRRSTDAIGCLHQWNTISNNTLQTAPNPGVAFWMLFCGRFLWGTLPPETPIIVTGKPFVESGCAAILADSGTNGQHYHA